MRTIVRKRFFAALNHLANIQDTRDIFARVLRSYNVLGVPTELAALKNFASPYSDLGTSRQQQPKTHHRKDIVFITGRFRSGTTLLWNIFRNIPTVTSYYEPFNERRWFDAEYRGSLVDKTHLNISNYWAEYEGLGHLVDHYNENWIRQQLYMGSSADNLPMQYYIESLIEASEQRSVLQFNRVDFRLAWLKKRFPHAKILHIYRHPRDQWYSTLKNNQGFTKDMKLNDFAVFDGYYLLSWGKDLVHHFPFLTLDPDSHPYELSYQLWKLSYIFGRNYANLSITLEELIKQPDVSITKILSSVDLLDTDSSGNLADLIKPIKTGRWREYADDLWFRNIEAKADRLIDSYFVQ